MTQHAVPVPLVLSAKQVLRSALIALVDHTLRRVVQIAKRVHKGRWLPLSWQPLNVWSAKQVKLLKLRQLSATYAFQEGLPRQHRARADSVPQDPMWKLLGLLNACYAKMDTPPLQWVHRLWACASRASLAFLQTHE